MNGMDVKGAFNIAAVSPDEIVRYAEEQLRGVESDCLLSLVPTSSRWTCWRNYDKPRGAPL